MPERIVLPALLGSHPLGALASFGLLRLIERWDSAARLGFAMRDDWVAFLETTCCESLPDLLSKLGEWVGSPEPDRALQWPGEDLRVQPAKYREALREALQSENPADTEFLSALVADGAIDKQKSLIKPSAFYMVSGQQRFCEGMRAILLAARKDPQSVFSEALQGPWAYSTTEHSLGWDPNTERLYALRHKAPTAESPRCVAGAMLLAYWALPLFPAVSRASRPFTIGFTRPSGGDYSFAWPVFSAPIGAGTLKSLLQTGLGGWLSRENRLRPGIEACYQARRFEFGQGYAVLRSAQVFRS